MTEIFTRRGVVAGALAFGMGATAQAAAPILAELERRHGGRLGVFALDAGSGASLAHRAGERFLMCSTFKALAVAAVLARVDRGREDLDRPVAYGERDLMAYAPVTRAHVAEGRLPLRTLCAAAVEVSDNGAANLILARLGGPAAVTRFARALGDPVTRLDRREPELNRPHGVLDTTTPAAMAGDLKTLLLGAALTPASRQLLEGWMVSATPGLKRLRAGFPPSWKAGDKSGTGRTYANDIAIVRQSGRAPLLVAAYYEAPALDAARREDVLRQVGAAVAAWAG